MISKAIKRFKIKYSNIKAVISYADTTVGHTGSIYKACGFVLDRVVRPDYWYVNEFGLVAGKKAIYNRAIKANLTEEEYVVKHSFSKIFGKEKLRFKYVLK